MGHDGQYEPVRAVNRETRYVVVQKPKDKRPQRRCPVDHDPEEHGLLKNPIEYPNFKGRCKPRNVNATPRRPSTPAYSQAAQTPLGAGNDIAQPLAFKIPAGHNGGGDDQDNDLLEVDVDPHREPVDARTGAGLGEARSHYGALTAEAPNSEVTTATALQLRHHKPSLGNTSNHRLNGANGHQRTGQCQQMLQHLLTLQNHIMLPYHFILPRLTRCLKSTATIDIFMEAQVPKSVHNVTDLPAAAELITGTKHQQRRRATIQALVSGLRIRTLRFAK